MSDGERSAGGRRALTYAVLLCLAGAGLALWAATRGWSVELTARPAPLPPVRGTRTGASLLPWLPALAVVTLAGAGAVLATRGRVRRVLGVLLAALGLVVAGGGGYALGADLGGPVSRQWPALCLLGGLAAAVGGGWTALRGGDWPAMGARYERPARVPEAATAAGSSTPLAGRRTTEAWNALDRGEDPTAD
ncbi:Trp biosynthesis-associated membrane protein [Micromonospora sp. WMMD1120]|uniref:Trp biosynthesis-associated membrane protein n=1 Tax=Micromonospora sp. WMMD1120 TaxID=3016106 RepID=UPI00241807FE|nr:Trp biosynthesis-associated membrane protein [Micromonospora sp. WMMD1120]MDG4805265.1 Trp biosynthesis-associated membrane protein [Micromonospora sp. WMMD1120]